MSTKIRPELSEKNPYRIEKHRYYELKHFCLQYPGWIKAYSAFSGINTQYSNNMRVRTSGYNDTTSKYAIAKEYLSKRITLVERCAKLTCDDLSFYIIKGVTEEYSYDVLKARFNIPCCKDIYYEMYRKFFWILDKERG